ncbi:unnamed protein product [Closterium sp. NIES-53]
MQTVGLHQQQLREWVVRRGCFGAGAWSFTAPRAAGPGGDGAVGAVGTRSAARAGAGGTGGSGGAGAAGPGGARTKGAGAAGAGGASGAGGAGGANGAAGTGGVGGTAGAGGVGAGGMGGARGATRAAGTGGAGGTACARGARARGARGATGAASAGVAGAAGARARAADATGQSQPQLLPGSSLPALAPHTKVTESLTERREPETRASTPVRARHVARPRPPAVPCTHVMALCPSSLPQRVPLPSPPASSLPNGLDPASDLARAAIPTITRLFATVVTNPDFESTVVFALVTELVDFASRRSLDYVASLVTESESVCPPSLGGEPALGCDLCPEGDPDAPDIPTPRSYAEAIAGEYSSQWQTTMDAEMASWKSTRTCVNEVPPPGANIVDGMWIFIVKRPPGSPPAFKARYVARGFTQRDYELHSLDFSTDFLQGSLHEEIWLRRPLGFIGSFPAGTQQSLPQPVYGLRQAPRKWHDTLRTTLAALGFTPSTADPSLFLRADTLLPPFYALVYVDDLVFATADSEALTFVKSELQKRHTCTDLGEMRSYLGLQITRDRARRTITLTQSHMVHQVLQRFGFQFSSPQPTPLSTGHSLSAPPSDESVEPNGLYPELVGCLMYMMTCTRPDLAYPLSLLDCYVAPGRHRKVHCDAAKRVLRYLCSTSGMGLVLRGRGSVVLTGLSDASWADDQATQCSSLGYTFSLGSGSVSRRTKHIALRYFLAQELQQRGQLRLSFMTSWDNTADVFTKALGSGDHQRFCTAPGLVPTLPHLHVYSC